MKRFTYGSPLQRAAAATAFLATAAAVHADHRLILHVDDDAAPGGDGRSWGTPFRDLQDAIEAARQASAVNSALERVDILLAQGVYRPDRATGDRSQSFEFDLSQLVSVHDGEVSVIGGFAGVTEPNPSLYDPARFETVLTGDLNGDDGPGFMNYADNSQRVVHAFGGITVSSGITVSFVRALVLESLTIRGGNADAPEATGAGALVQSAKLRMDDCRVIENQGRGSGVGVCLDGADGLIRGTLIVGNRAIDSQLGGGVGLLSSEWFMPCSGRLVDCVISNNATSGNGGGIGASDAFVSVERCSIVDNAAGWIGGGAYFGADAMLDRTLVAGNSAGLDAGGMALQGDFEVSSSIVAANVAAGHGGGLRLGGSANGRVVQSTITGNLAQTGAGLFWFGSPWFTCDVVGAIIWGNDSFEGGEIQVEGFEAAPPRNLSSSIRGWPEARDPMFMDPAGPDRDPLTWADNDYTPSPASTVIDWGWPVPEPGSDFFGRPRTFDHPAHPSPSHYPACDIGAIEFWPCACDADVDGAVTVFDLLAYLGFWFAGEARAEVDGAPPVDVFDLLAFLDCWFAADEGCE